VRTTATHPLSLHDALPSLILPREQPHSSTGGLAVLFGNLAPEGAVVKTGAVDPAMRKHSGPARIYESQEEALRGIYNGEVQPGRSEEHTSELQSREKLVCR